MMRLMRIGTPPTLPLPAPLVVAAATAWLQVQMALVVPQWLAAHEPLLPAASPQSHGPQLMALQQGAPPQGVAAWQGSTDRRCGEG
jgi:hypothetical protein